MRKMYSTDIYIMSFFYNMFLMVLLLVLSYYRPRNEDSFFYIWILGVVALYIVWIKLENTILNKIFLLLFAPVCISTSILGVESAATYFEGIKQYMMLNLIVVFSWCILALVGDIKKVKPAMLTIEALLKTLVAIIVAAYLINIVNDDIQRKKLKEFIDVLSLPLVLAVIWGRLVLELRVPINKFLHRCIFSFFARYCGNKIALKLTRKLRRFMKAYIINKV